MQSIEQRLDRRRKIITISFVILTILFFLTLVSYMLVLRDVRHLANENKARITENRARINDIQNSRVESCKRTYEGVRDVFNPFIPPPSARTKRQQADIDKFNKVINKLKKGCVTQTRPQGTEETGQ